MESHGKHILLNHAVTYDRFSGSLAPEGCRYDPDIGAWVVSETGELFVETLHRSKPQTKKQDIETGEDQKAE